jgi:hypothetical protein
MSVCWQLLQWLIMGSQKQVNLTSKTLTVRISCFCGNEDVFMIKKKTVFKENAKHLINSTPVIDRLISSRVCLCECVCSGMTDWCWCDCVFYLYWLTHVFMAMCPTTTRYLYWTPREAWTLGSSWNSSRGVSERGKDILNSKWHPIL